MQVQDINFPWGTIKLRWEVWSFESVGQTRIISTGNVPRCRRASTVGPMLDHGSNAHDPGPEVTNIETTLWASEEKRPTWGSDMRRWTTKIPQTILRMSHGTVPSKPTQTIDLPKRSSESTKALTFKTRDDNPSQTNKLSFPAAPSVTRERTWIFPLPPWHQILTAMPVLVSESEPYQSPDNSDRPLLLKSRSPTVPDHRLKKQHNQTIGNGLMVIDTLHQCFTSINTTQFQGADGWGEQFSEQQWSLIETWAW